MLPLGTKAPDFQLPDAVSGKMVSLQDFSTKPALVVMFICNHCPYVKHLHQGLVEFAKDYQKRNVAMVAISSNDAEDYPEDAPEKMKEEARRVGYSFPYLYDETQEVAKAYRAACTPDFFLFDANQKLIYRGQFDESRPGNQIPVTGKDLREAMDALLANKAISAEQKPSMGCNIKWKSGNAPDYFKAY
jgi:peroxiredoxin